MAKLFLLDAYALIYRAYYGFIKNPRINSKGENTSAVLGFVNTLEEILTKENPDYIGVAFDPHGPTFRHEAFPDYKAQREETPEGIRFAVPIIKDVLKAYRIPVLEVSGFEADDVIGTLAKQSESIEGIDTYMMTPDKDYGQLVAKNVKMYKPRFDGGFDVLGEQEVKAKYGISDVKQVIDLLGLMGDSSDNYPGCPGVGEKTAVKLINEFGSIEGLLANIDQLKGAMKKKVEEHVEDIKMSKFLAAIKTDVPITLDLNSLKREPIDEIALKEIFERLEFRTLSKRKFASADQNDGTVSPTPSTPTNGKKGKAQMNDLFSGDLFGGSTQTTQNASSQASEKPVNPTTGQGDLFFSNLSDLSNTPHNYQLVDSEEEAKNLAAKILTFDFVSLDTETTSVDAMSAKLVGLSFSVNEGEGFYVPIPYHEEWSGEDFEDSLRVVNIFKEVYESEKIIKVGQNIKYDMMVLANYGIELRGKMFDTMIAHYIIAPELRHNMDYLAEVYLKYQTIHIDSLIGAGKKQRSMHDLDPKDVYEYAAEDADVTLKLKNILEKELYEKGLWQLFDEVEMPLVPVLARMEMNGARIDEASLAETSKVFTERMEAIEQEIREVAGQELNISSPKQIGELLFDRLKIDSKPKKTKTGQYVTDEATLLTLKSKHPVVEKILDYRGYKKLLSTYIDALPQLVNPRTGHIHTSYNQAVTATGRLSSSNPNLQNIPIRDENGKEVRKAFIPDEGELFFSADYSQIELRLMAHLSQDKNMVEDFNSGHDIHQATAAKIFKVPLEEVTSTMRRKAKTANFGIIYGISAFGLAERMEVSRGEARQLIDDYFATYPGVKEYMDKSIEKARQLGYTETLLGRRCQLPDINSRNAVVRGYAERNAINAPIQGTAADIIKVAMIRIDKRIREEGLRSKMILQVHDELNFSVVPEEKEQLQTLVINEMQNAIKLSVPLYADCGWGENWLEAH
ncbi:MAG: DNA polymerase I [Bacteroidaceae bacterium]|nr:DNA polymerase I [Bacteroidaceae bacterium]